MTQLPTGASAAEGLRVLKGHGTENDFVIIPDAEGELDLSASLVRALCDRRGGIGADGVLRVVRSSRIDAGVDAAGAEWFMDYRNADGSLAEMCGNGVRVFARYLAATGAIGAEAAIGTRGGTVFARLLDDGTVAVELGKPQLLADRPTVTVASAGGDLLPPHRAVSVDMPNPHAVVQLDDPQLLDVLDLCAAPRVEPGRPDGQNVEFAVVVGNRHARMRVFERGVGETRSCGTGIAAVVAALGAPDGAPWRVDVPGGTCTVTWNEDGIVLAGPAVLVAEVDVTAEWLSAVHR